MLILTILIIARLVILRTVYGGVNRYLSSQIIYYL